MPLTKIISISGKAVPVAGADMDTDRIIPARFLKCVTFDELAGTMFWDERFNADGSSKGHPIDAPQHAGATIILGGENFGCGSSREHAPVAIKASGISCVIASTFARIFFRNALNIGLPILECGEAAKNIKAGDTVSVDFNTGVITNETSGQTFQAEPFPPFMQNLIACGGLVNYSKSKIGK